MATGSTTKCKGRVNSTGLIRDSISGATTTIKSKVGASSLGQTEESMKAPGSMANRKALPFIQIHKAKFATANGQTEKESPG